jgi:hypothetical protein
MRWPSKRGWTAVTSFYAVRSGPRVARDAPAASCATAHVALAASDAGSTARYLGAHRTATVMGQEKPYPRPRSENLLTGSWLALPANNGPGSTRA